MGKNIFLMLVFIFFAQNSFAESYFARTKIERLIIHDSKDIIVTFQDPVAAEGCNNKTQVALRRSNESFKEIYAALLVAYSSDRTIDGFLNGCSNEWQSKGMSYLIRLDLVK